MSFLSCELLESVYQPSDYEPAQLSEERKAPGTNHCIISGSTEIRLLPVLAYSVRNVLEGSAGQGAQ